MRALYTIPIVVLIVAAGCLDAKKSLPDVGDPGAIVPPLPTFLSYKGCQEHLGVFPVPMGELGPLPEGFTYAPFDPAGALATVAIIAFRCQSLASDNATEGSAGGMVTLAVVSAPTALQRDDATYHTILLGLITSSAAAQRVYHAWNVTQAARGDVTLEEQVTPVGQLGGAMGTADGASVALITLVHEPKAAQTNGLSRIFVAQNGQLVSVYDLAWNASAGLEGVAYLQEPADVPGIPDVVRPGLGFHYWGTDYGYNLTHVALPTST